MPGEESGVAGGNVDFGEFCDAHYDELRRAFRRARGVGLEPLEIVHETLLIAGRWYHEFASDAELLVWCKVVGTNLINRLAEIAQRQRRRLHLAVVPAALLVNAEEQAVEAADLTRALARLPHRQKQALELSALGYNDNAIGDILDLNAVAVRQLLTRARKSARKGLGQIVAGFLPASHSWIRKVSRGTSPPAQAMVASVVTVSVVAALVFPVNYSASRHSPPGAFGAERLTFLSAPHQPELPRIRPTALDPQPALSVASTSGPGNRTPRHPRLVAPFPTACAGRVCISSSCSADEPRNGDRLYLQPTGPCREHVSEDVLPVCEFVPDNPAVGCQRDGDPQWVVDPPPPTSPKGGPL